MAGYIAIHTEQERQLTSGFLSVTTTFRLLMTGTPDAKHLDRIISILKMQKQFLEEDETVDLMPDLVWYCPPALQQTPGA